MSNIRKLQPYDYDRYKYMIENIKDVVWEMDMDFNFTFVSPNSKEMVGYEPEDLVGCKMPDFLTEKSRNYVLDQAVQHLSKRLRGDHEEIVLHNVEFICTDGLVKWVEISAKPVFKEGRFAGYIGTTRDISERKGYESQLKRYIEELQTINDKLEKMATTDELTGAYNRRKFDDDLNSIIMKKKIYGTSFSLIFFDIDRFKIINDSFGHKVGDYVLQSVSRLVREHIRATDGLFRWGGEEFIIILPEVNLESAKNVADKIRVLIQDHDFGIEKTITISLGVGEYKPGEDIDQVIVRLDNALLRAKSKGRNRAVFC
jgi:diguanylate cyclase (GGDEF)-like protein/PAS domain S-box-containing protein